jgi:hypothetical protein
MRGVFVVLLASLMLVLSACSRGDEELIVPVSGVVEFDGKPLEGATVTFFCREKDRYAVGQSDTEGRFQLTTKSPGDGAVPGEHQVMISKMVLEEHMHIPPGQPKPDRPDPKGRFRWVIPQKYGDFTRSGLTATVPDSGTNSLTLTLK